MTRPKRSAEVPAIPIDPDGARDVRETSADIGGRIAAIDAELAATAPEILRREAFEAEALLDATDAELDENDVALVRLKRKEARLARHRERETAALAEALSREAEDGRRERFAAAGALVGEAEAWILGDYAAAASTIRVGLDRLLEIHDIVRTANDDRPEGAALLEVEACRHLARVPDEVTFEAERYFVGKEGQEIVPSPDSPLSQDASGQFWIDGKISVTARERQARDVIPGRSKVSPASLASAVRLPRVRYAEPDLWPRRSAAWEI